MDFIDAIRAIARRAEHAEHLQTEEATKMALVVPFIQALGYDVYNPFEVIPEFTADVGTKKGEKVDYAVQREGKPIMLFECKKVGVDLDKAPASQLFRYFAVTDARVGVLTDGLIYYFYSDLDADNKMDELPFLVFDICRFDEAMARHLKRFAKASFDIDDLLSAAEELKYTRAIKLVMAEELRSPSEELVKLLTKRVYSGLLHKAAKEKFTGIVKRSLQGFINDRVDDRLKAALGRTDSDDETGEVANADGGFEPPREELPDGVVRLDGNVVTTEEEMDGFYVVRAIVRSDVVACRVSMRDTKSYCGILLDNNNRKPICRLHFNSKSRKQLGLFDAQKNETRVVIESVDDIYMHADALRAVIRCYLEAERQ